jgi:hypothetical protein
MRSKRGFARDTAALRRRDKFGETARDCGDRSPVGFAMNAGYRQTYETTNEFVAIKF